MMDATAEAELIRKGEVSIEEMVMSAINRIEAVDGYLNAVVTNLDEALLAAKNHDGKGPFPGVPYLIKDLLNHKGVSYRRFSHVCKSHCHKIPPMFRLHLIWD